MEQRLTSRQQQAIQTKEKILAEGRKLIEQKPISEINIPDITKACGIATGTFYHYFSSKEELFAQLTWISHLKESTHYDDKNTPFMIRIRDYFIMRAHHAEQDGLSLTRNFTQFRLTSAYRDIRNEVFDGKHYDYEICSVIFQEAIDNNELSKDFPVEFFSDMLVYMIHGIIFNECLYDEPLKIVPWFSEFLDYFENVSLKPYMLKPKVTE